MSGQIRIPRIKLVLGKGQRRNRRRRLALTAPFVPFTLGWAGNVIVPPISVRLINWSDPSSPL